MKGRKTLAGIALLAFLILTAANGVIFRGLSLLYKLESRNEAEQTMNALFTSLRIYDDFGAAIEQNEALRQRVLGIGIYGSEGGKIYSWGEVPSVYNSGDLPEQDEGNQVRMYEESAKNRSLILFLRPARMIPPPPPREAAASAGEAGSAKTDRERPRSFMLELLHEADLVRLELRQPEYWRKTGLLAVLFPVVEAFLAALVFSIRFLVVRNREYQDRLEKQKNLVVLGTAASTLAHEIKNPLLAIRLQTSILGKTLPEDARGELEVINAEVDRLSRLTTRIGDYLRDPKGFPAIVNPAEIADEVGLRLCGRPLADEGGAERRIFIDPERFRSILENLLSNAMESGSPLGDLAVTIRGDSREVRVEVLDRGGGISREEKTKIFDPFFTTKSKGTGIGLAICERFARAAGGTIGLENRPGGGCRARLTFPEARARASGTPS